MKKIFYRCLALGMALFLVCQVFPLSAWAQWSDAGAHSSEAGTTEEPGEESSLEAEWEGTGALNADGTPVTSEEGDTPEASGVTPDVLDEKPAQPMTYTVTLNLDGGTVNGMQSAGWTQSSYQTYQWLRTVTEAEAGQGVSVTMNETLGGWLPSEPYREGYTFTGWKVGDTDGSGTITIHENTTVVAQWQVSTYTVSFQGNEGQIWSVDVPYGATLWTESDTPWTAADVSWTENTASVDITVGETKYEGVTVTRHESGDARYYYTFTIGGMAYFTYGGPVPTMVGQNFVSWKLTSGGTGFTVTEDAVFTAQFQVGKSYVVNVYYYYENGNRAKDTFAITKGEADEQNGKLILEVPVPEITHYTADPKQQDGITWEDDGTVTVDVNTVFGADNTSATNFLALTVIYRPSTLNYTVEYYQQGVDEKAPYTYVGSIETQGVKYGNRISITDRPDLGQGISFNGFQVSVTSQSAVYDGLLLQEGTPGVSFDENGDATIEIYYDRASYFIYFQTGTTEAQLEPIKVQYGAAIPAMDTYLERLSRAGYEKVTENDVSWYHLGEDGTLVAESQWKTMPPYDLYAVVTWRPATTSIQLIYWIESRNAASFQVADIVTVDQVKTEGELNVNLAGGVTIDGAGWPDATDGATIVSERFKQLITEQYGSEKYTTFFSYSPEQTKTSPGNVANAQATNSGQVQDGAITQDTYTVKVNGDGTTSINIYYTRNLYTLEFVLARNDGDKVWVSTDGRWAESPSGTSLVFKEFGSTVTATSAAEGETYGGLKVQTTYRLTEAMGRDARSAVGRYGTSFEDGYDCCIYTLTARFEADISALWPTVSNVTTEKKDGGEFSYKYVSMGPSGDSYYRHVVAGSQKNILNVYSTMDRDVVAMGTVKDQWSATADPGTGTVSHRMVAYWAENPTPYHYYFLYEVLDTTIAKNSDQVKAFDPAKADKGEYHTGDYVSWNEAVYVYSETSDLQYSTNTPNGQNQPSRQGFEKKGKSFTGKGSERSERNIYFFYDRETYNLDVQNINARYSVPASLLTTEFESLSSYGEGIKTLRQLGWEAVNSDGTVAIRYGGVLAPMGNEDVVDWLTRQNGGNLAYPIQSAGESQYYFWRWYSNATLDVPVDWDNDNEMRIVSSDKTLYAGWFSPRYTTTYVLNGGTWTDKIDYALSTAMTQDHHTVYIYYPHQAQNETDPLYWYIQTKDEDRLFVNTLYVCEVGKVAHKDESGAYWELNDDLTVDKMLEVSQEDTHGTRLVGHNYCYAGEGGAYNHEKYININSAVNSVLAEPTQPVRAGYTFNGWYYFDDVPAQGTKTYLKDVLTVSQSLTSYGEEYVYVNHVGDAFLLHKDDNGELFYYPEQTGYRFSYSNNASVVVQDRQIYAAWEAKYDAKAVVYHLVEKSKIDGVNWLTPKDGNQIDVQNCKTITLGGVEYCILSEEQLNSLHTGNTYAQTAWEYCTGEVGEVWLPTQASIELHVDDRTQTVAEGALDTVKGNTYRVESDGTYTYYAFFVYRPTPEVVYNVYTIDLSVAVAEGALPSYQDTFDRSVQVDPSEPYFLGMQQKTFPLEDVETTVVVENAPAVNGYVVYQELSQKLQLQTEGNNIFFYYVRDNSPVIPYTITYYLMEDGGYSPENKVTISNIPAVTGEIISLSNLISTYDRLVTMAQTYSTYAGKENAAMKSLYERYKDMTITWTQNGQETSFTVDADVQDTLNLSDIAGLHLDYYVDTYSPSGTSLVVSNGTKVEVYLAKASLVVQKINTSQVPLAGAEFQLERLVEDADGDISYNGKTYAVDPTFTPVTATSGEDGKAMFHNLSARVLGEGKGYVYRLTETQAPKGYNRLTSPMYVTTPYTVDGEIHYDVTYTVVNSGISYLPGSGLFGGVYITMFLGIGLMAFAAGGGLLYSRRKKSRS